MLIQKAKELNDNKEEQDRINKKIVEFEHRVRNLFNSRNLVENYKKGDFEGIYNNVFLLENEHSNLIRIKYIHSESIEDFYVHTKDEYRIQKLSFFFKKQILKIIEELEKDFLRNNSFETYQKVLNDDTILNCIRTLVYEIKLFDKELIEECKEIKKYQKIIDENNLSNDKMTKEEFEISFNKIPVEYRIQWLKEMEQMGRL